LSGKVDKTNHLDRTVVNYNVNTAAVVDTYKKDVGVSTLNLLLPLLLLAKTKDKVKDKEGIPSRIGCKVHILNKDKDKEAGKHNNAAVIVKTKAAKIDSQTAGKAKTKEWPTAKYGRPIRMR
jgi:hypothetical protein